MKVKKSLPRIMPFSQGQTGHWFRFFCLAFPGRGRKRNFVREHRLPRHFGGNWIVIVQFYK